MKTANPVETCAKKFYVHENILRTRNFRHNFIKNLLKNVKETYKPNNRDLNRD